MEGKGDGKGRWVKGKEGRERRQCKRGSRRYIKRKSRSFCTKLPGWRPQHISFVGTDRSQTFFALSSHVRELE